METVLTEMIPRPSRRETEPAAATVWVRRFMLSPESQAAVAQGVPDLRAALTEQLLRARRSDEATARSDAESDAGGLIALLDGLIFNMVVGQETAESATAIMRAQLDRLLPGDHRQ